MSEDQASERTYEQGFEDGAKAVLQHLASKFREIEQSHFGMAQFMEELPRE